MDNKNERGSVRDNITSVNLRNQPIFKADNKKSVNYNN